MQIQMVTCIKSHCNEDIAMLENSSGNHEKPASACDNFPEEKNFNSFETELKSQWEEEIIKAMRSELLNRNQLSPGRLH